MGSLGDAGFHVSSIICAEALAQDIPCELCHPYLNYSGKILPLFNFSDCIFVYLV